MPAATSVVYPPSFRAGSREEMAASMQVYRAEVGNLVQGVRSGARSVASAEAAARDLLSRSYERAYRQGLASLGVHRFGSFDSASIRAAVDNEMRFVSRFLADVKAGVGTVPYAVRAASYTRGYESMYVVGQVQALPWETDIYWRLSATDHCKDCMSLADASPFSKATLPVVPGSGGTQCLYNCGCFLEYALRQPQRKELESRPGRVSSMTRVAGELPAGKRLPTDEELDEIRDLWGKIQFHRTAVRYYPAELKAAHAAARADANEALIKYLDDHGVHWTRGMEDDLFNPPPGGGEGAASAAGRAGAESGGPVIVGAGTGGVSPAVMAEPLRGVSGPDPVDGDA